MRTATSFNSRVTWIPILWADSRFAPRQGETVLLCNDASFLLGAGHYPALILIRNANLNFQKYQLIFWIVQIIPSYYRITLSLLLPWNRRNWHRIIITFDNRDLSATASIRCYRLWNSTPGSCIWTNSSQWYKVATMSTSLTCPGIL